MRHPAVIVAATAIPAIIVGILLGIFFKPNVTADGNPVGPIRFAAQTSPNLTGNRDVENATKCIDGTYVGCTVTLYLATTVSPSPAPNNLDCGDTGDTGCFQLKGPMKSTDATTSEDVNFTETLMFQPPNGAHAHTGIPITTHTPPPDDGNPVGLRAAGMAHVQMPKFESLKQLPSCMTNQTCKVIVVLALPTQIAPGINCAQGMCITFNGKQMAVKGLDWEHLPRPDKQYDTEKRDVTGTIYIGP